MFHEVMETMHHAWCLRVTIYGKSSINPPTMGSALNGPFREVAWLGTCNIITMGSKWSDRYRGVVDLWRWSIRVVLRYIVVSRDRVDARYILHQQSTWVNMPGPGPGKWRPWRACRWRRGGTTRRCRLCPATWGDAPPATTWSVCPGGFRRRAAGRWVKLSEGRQW